MERYMLRAQDWWILVIRGVAALFLGLFALFLPGLTIAALVLLFGAYAVVDGFAAIINAFRQRTGEWGWHFVQGLLGIGAGFIALLAPAFAALALAILIAVWAILSGASQIALAIQLHRKVRGEWLWAVAGVLSIIFGFIALAFPAAGLLATVWILGSYWLLLGAIWVALGISLRTQPARTVAS